MRQRLGAALFLTRVVSSSLGVQFPESMKRHLSLIWLSVKHTVTFLAVIAGIGGVGMWQLWNTRLRWYICGATILSLPIYTLINYRRQQFTTKGEIEQLRRTLFSMASKSIDIFAGDGSWLGSDWQLL